MDVSVKFVDFWPVFDQQNNKFIDALKAKYNVRVIPNTSKESPDILIYSLLGIEHFNYSNCIKVYYTGENDVPNFNECDYAISFHHIKFGQRHLRYPLYMFYEYEQAKNPPILSDKQATERAFCSALLRIRKTFDQNRIAIIDALDSYKPIAYGGPWRNNVGGPVDEKIPFIANYKFNLALENSCINGYVTEKIVEPFAAATVPIYWGAPDIATEFNPYAFINASDFDSPNSLLKYIKYLDNNNDEYLKILRSPATKADIFADFDSQLSEYLCNIVDSGFKKHVPKFGMTPYLLERNRKLQNLYNSKTLKRIINRLY